MSDLSSVIDIVLQDQAACLPEIYRDSAPDFFQKILSAPVQSDEISKALDVVMSSSSAIDDRNAHAQLLADIYLSWRTEGAASPYMVHIVRQVLDRLGVVHGSRLGKACFAAALLSDLPNHNSFHSNAHFKDITLTALSLCSLQNSLISEQPLTNEDICLVLIAAMVHDFCHDGRGNALDGVHLPMRLEKKAFDNAKLVLKHAGLKDEELQRVRLMILCTDVSYGPKALSPSRVLNKCYRYFYKEAPKPSISTEEYRFIAEALLDDQKLCLMAMILEEADIFTSVGLSYDYAKMTTLLVAEETEILKGNASTLHGFIEMICQGLISTEAATFLFSDTFQSVYDQASKDVQRNLDYRETACA